MESSSTTPETAASQFLSIPIEQIKPARHQARKQFDEEAIKGLADSMKQEGLIQPITVRPAAEHRGTGEPGQAGETSRALRGPDALMLQYELVSGERRLRAAKLLGWTVIDAKIIQTVSEAEAAAKGMIENLQREDLNPMEEAEGLADLHTLDPKYWTQTKIAQITGKSQGHVSETLRFLDLSDKIKDNIRQRILTPQHGAELLRLPVKEIQDKAADKILMKGLNVKQTRDLVNKLLAKTEGKEDPFGQAVAQLPSPFKFTRKGSGAKIIAFYPGNGDLDNFLADLRSAYLAWLARGKNKVESDPMVEPAITAASVTWSYPRFPKTPEEQAELEQIASSSSGPGPLYAWICGSDSKVMRLVASMTWQDIGAKDGMEALPQVIEAVKLGQEKGF